MLRMLSVEGIGGIIQEILMPKEDMMQLAEKVTYQ